MRKIFYAAILILFCAIDAHAQGGAFGDVVFGPNIAIKPGASVTVCTHPSTVASCPANKIILYSDVNLVTPVTNPVVTDGNGHWLVYAPSGTFDYIVTGTGITPQTVPFTFSIGGSGGACSTVLKTNGSTNTDQCLLDLTAGTNITLANVAGVTTINATGGGSGCTLPGHDTGVLSEHPTNTCYNSLDYTWDDTNFRFQAGSGALGGGFGNVNAGSIESFILGVENDSTNCVTCEILGLDNTISYDLAGTNSSRQANFSVGRDNNITASLHPTIAANQSMGQIGNDNDLEYADRCYQVGGQNSINGAIGTANPQDCMEVGFSNTLTTNSGSADAANLNFMAGADLNMTQTSTNQMHHNFEYGYQDAINTTNGRSAFGFIYGFDDTIDGIDNLTDMTQFGNSNEATNLLTSGIYAPAGDNIQIGAQLVMDNVGLGWEGGMLNNLHNCVNCQVLGYNNNFSTTNALSIGMGGNELVMTPGLITLNAPQAVSIANASSTGTTLNKLAKLTGAPSTAVITSTSDVTGAAGIVSLGAGTTGSASVSKLGITLCVFDGATTAGDYVNISTSTAGDCHDAGASQPLYSIGRVMSTNGGGGTYPVDLIIGAGTGGAVATQGKVALTGQTTSLSPTALITTPASPSIGAYRVTTALSCDASSASATVTFTLAWTDPSSTSQSITSSAATCTTLGSASYQSLSYAINVKEGTAINYSTTIANTPTYTLHVLLEGAW